MTKFYLYSLIALLVLSCASSTIPTKVLSQPDWNNIDDEEEVRRVVLTSTNFFNGSIEPKTENLGQAGIIAVGGAENIKKYVEVLRTRYEDQVLLVDSGEISAESSNKKDISNILKSYKDIGYDAIQFSEKEFVQISKKTVRKYKNRFINTNIIDLKKQGPYSSRYISPYRIKKINGVKIGIMAVSTFKNKDISKNKSLKGLYFEDPVLSILKAHKRLKRKGVKLFVLLMHTHDDCKESSCSTSEETMAQVIKRLPPNSVHAIIGSAPTMINRKINGIPVIQNKGEGQYISRVELFYNLNQKKFLSDRTIIHSPTKLCSKFFSVTQDCHIEIDEHTQRKAELIRESNFQKERAKFLGIEI
jgi:2',3'-cyclic-nucleotide 2'-phosphodiesterase (5'-nucleotidase family)